MGEDPILAGSIDAEWIQGVQSQGVIGDVKHYAVNDQETGRYFVNAIIDKRVMRESDLLAFEIGVKQGKPSRNRWPSCASRHTGKREEHT